MRQRWVVSDHRSGKVIEGHHPVFVDVEGTELDHRLRTPRHTRTGYCLLAQLGDELGLALLLYFPLCQPAKRARKAAIG